MDKMRMETLDLTQGNIEKIGALFPNCVTETKGEDGKLKNNQLRHAAADAFRRCGRGR